MMTFKTFAPTAAFVFTGYTLPACNGEPQNSGVDPIHIPDTVAPEPVVKAVTPPRTTVTPPLPPKPIELALETHPMAPAQAKATLQRAYRILKRDGVTREDLDMGCHQKAEIVGAGDRKVESCEVYEYALDHYKEHRHAADLLARGTVPWVLDDLDPTTDFDATIREKVDHAIEALKNSPALKDLDPASNEYRDKLAFGLFYYVSFPDRPIRGAAAKKRWKELTRELRVLGLHDFQAYLLQKGGLGIQQFDERSPVSKNVAALDSLAEKEGGSIAKANILYAVFDMADLAPFFVAIPYTAGDAHLDFEVDKGRTPENRYYKSEYKGIGIPMSDSFQLFHPQAMLSLRSYAEHSRYNGLRHFLSLTLRMEGQSFDENHRDKVKAGNYYRASIELWPEDGDAYNSLALDQSGEEAEKTFREGLLVDPDNWFLNNNFASHLAENGRHREAVSYLWTALEMHPEYFIKNHVLKAVKDIAKKALQLNGRLPQDETTRQRAEQIQHNLKICRDRLR